MQVDSRPPALRIYADDHYTQAAKQNMHGLCASQDRQLQYIASGCSNESSRQERG